MLRLTLFLLLLSQPLAAQTAVDVAQRAVQGLEDAAQQLSAARKAKDRVSALTSTVRAYETGLVAMRDGLRRVTIAQGTLTKQLESQRDEIAQLLGVLQTVERSPDTALILHPDGPLGTARSGMILADVTPALTKKADILRQKLSALQNLKLIQTSAKDSLKSGLKGAQQARSDLSFALQSRSSLPRRFAEDQTKVLQLLSSADTLSAFAAGLEETYLSGPENPATAQSLKGGLRPPVQGQLLRDFEQPDAAGVKRPGVILATRPGAVVTTPTAATLLFKGPLLDYGTVVILEPAAQVLFVFSGLETVYGEVGQVLPAGSPLGEMGGITEGGSSLDDQNVTVITENFTGQFTQSLYLEVRERQTPVNPSSWFTLK